MENRHLNYYFYIEMATFQAKLHLMRLEVSHISKPSLASKFESKQLLSKRWNLNQSGSLKSIFMNDKKTMKLMPKTYKGFYIHALSESYNNKEQSKPSELLHLVLVSNVVNLIESPTEKVIVLEDGSKITSNTQKYISKPHDHVFVSSAILLKVLSKPGTVIPIIANKKEVSRIKAAFQIRQNSNDVLNHSTKFIVRKDFGNGKYDYVPKKVVLTKKNKKKLYSTIFYSKIEETEEFGENEISVHYAILFACMLNIPIYVNQEFLESESMCILDGIEIAKIQNSSLVKEKSIVEPFSRESTKEMKEFKLSKKTAIVIRLLIAIEEECYEDAIRWRNMLNRLSQQDEFRES